MVLHERKKFSMKMKVSTSIESIHYLTSISTMSEFRTFLMDKNKCPDFLLKTLASECYAYYIHHEFDRMGYIYKMIENICKSDKRQISKICLKNSHNLISKIRIIIQF